MNALSIIELKRAKSLAKFGEQNHPNGIDTSIDRRDIRDAQRRFVDRLAAEGKSTWYEILQEEYFEMQCAENPDELIGELADIANVAMLWIEAIQRQQEEALDLLARREPVEVTLKVGVQFEKQTMPKYGLDQPTGHQPLKSEAFTG